MSFPHDPLAGLQKCLDAQQTPIESITNTDMDGIAVAVTNVVVNLCLRIQVTWSPDDIGPGIGACLIQFYPILLSTVLSINRQQLSLFDANYALLLSSSPLMVYLVVASVCDLFGFKTGLYKRIRSHRLALRTLTILVPFFWLGLNMSLMLAHSAFKDSDLCRNSTFLAWFLNFFNSVVKTTLTPGVMGLEVSVPVTTLFIIFLFRGIPSAVEHIQNRRRRELEQWGPWRITWEVLKRTWYSLNHNHKWCLYLVFAYLDGGWASQVISSAISATGKGYVLSYGQLLSIYVAIPPLITTAKLIYAGRWDVFHFFRTLPGQLVAEVKYFVTGIKQGPPVQDHRLPSTLPPTWSSQPPTKRATL